MKVSGISLVILVCVIVLISGVSAKDADTCAGDSVTQAGNLHLQNPTTARTTVPVTTETTAVPASAPAPAGSCGLPVSSIIIGAVAIVLVVVGIVLARRWWIRRQNPALFRDQD